MTREERTKLINHLKYNRSIGADYLITDKDADEIIKALEQEPLLNKIRAEIEQVKSIMNEEIINHDRKDLINFVNGLNQRLVIINRYKAESEDKE